MRWSDVPLNPSTRMLRQFAGLWIVFFGGLALWKAFAGNDSLAWVFAALALIVGPAGLVHPPLIRPIFIGWTVAVFPIGWVVSRVIVAVLFVAIVCPVGLVFRLIGRDALRVTRRHQESYWLIKPVPADVSSYYRQS